MGNRINLTEFRKRSDAKSWLIVTSHISLVMGAVFLAVWIGTSWWWIGLWLWFGLLMSGLLNLMHECAHYHVFQDRKGSDWLGHWVLAPLLLADFDGYRERHWKHHTHLGIDGDTKDAYLVDVRGFGLFRLLLQCLTLHTALGRFGKQLQPGDLEKVKRRDWMKRTVVVQVVFLASLLIVAGPMAGRNLWPSGLMAAGLAYGLIYGYGLASLTVYAATLRAIAEHQIEVGQSSETGRAALRNFQCGPVSWLIFGAYGFAEHATHHREPALAYYHLQRATEYLATTDHDLLPKHRYVSEILKLAEGKPARS